MIVLYVVCLESRGYVLDLINVEVGCDREIRKFVVFVDCICL